jgi:hypothetical protein
VTSTEDDAEFTGATTRTPKDVYLQIVPLKLHGEGSRTADTYGLLDNGSQSTLIREDMAKQLGLQGKNRTINFGTVTDQKRIKVCEVQLHASARNGDNKTEIASAYVRPPSQFNMPSKPSPDGFDISKYMALDGINIDEVNPEDITILIGGNVPKAVLASESRYVSEDLPVAVKTIFGWTLFGPTYAEGERRTLPPPTEAVNLAVQSLWKEEMQPPKVHCNLMMSAADIALHKSVERLWAQEECGIQPAKDLAMSRQDIEAMETLEKGTIQLENGQYQVPMLWCNEETVLPNNRPMADKRFLLLERRLRRNSSTFKGMKAVIDGYLEEDPPYARKMSKEEAEKLSPRTHYLPIHPVVNPNKPGKVRVVNDAAAVYQGQSLNSNLLSGPDLLTSLVGILMSFRCHAVAIAADVEAMFHRVRVSPEDSDSLRFLWKEDILSNDPPDTYQMLVHIFGAKDSPACANYALKRIARDHGSDYEPATVECVLKYFYVDDLLRSLLNENAAIKTAHELISLLKRGGFRLTKFLSNSKTVLDALPQTEVSPSVLLDLDVERLERALGVFWDTANDVLTFKANLKENPPTKRGVLSTSASLYDPLGFIVPFLITARIILQELWRRDVGWDEVLEGDLRVLWDRWLDGAKKVADIKLNRRYIMSDEPISVIQLHVFCDASEAAYGCVAYLRVSLKSGTHVCSFVMSKSRLAPIKTITLPRLELNAARAGARMSHLVVHSVDLPIEAVHYWSDSTLTLQYINNKKHRMKVFVANRVTEILQFTVPEQWHHIPGTINPADILSRGVYDPVKLATGVWFDGPEFLAEEEAKWPSSSLPELDVDDPEIKRKTILIALGLAKPSRGDRIDVDTFSSWVRLRRVVAWIVRFAHNLQKGNEKKVGSLQVAEIMVAERFLVKDSQHTAFESEIRVIREGSYLPDSNKLSALSPWLDEHGVLRVGGRLTYLPIPSEAKHPAILPRNHTITRLMIDWLHRSNGHVGREHVLSLLRENYWVIAARTAINSVLRLCFLCKVRRARRQFPMMANLPTDRAAIEEAPFTNCGVDLFGPVLIKQGRKQLKRWVVLFTCLTVRCVHLEYVETAETDSFINSMRRFTNRRGCPKKMRSDNGTNFRGASAELKEVITNLDQAAISDFATGLQIEWDFNPPKAPHMGGIWERMVRSVKEVLYGLLKDHVLTDPQLHTVLTEAEHIVNSRPITHVSDDVNDLEALTPNHLLLGRHRNWSAIIDTSCTDVFSRKKWKQVQGIRATFWDRWRREYLPTLSRRPKWRKEKINFQPGELVLLRDDDFTKRNKWPLARITKVLPGRDNVVRVVEIKTKDGEYTRPVAGLYKLEGNMDDVRQGRGCVTDGEECGTES